MKKNRSMEQKHIPRINPYIDLQNGFTVKINLFTKKGVRAYTRKRAVSSINCVGKTGQAHVKE